MARANIYIRAENEERWKLIENKSHWINAMLATPAFSETDISMVEQNNTYKPKAENNFYATREGLKYCKNGHALDDNGRCFGKGCKYA